MSAPRRLMEGGASEASDFERELLGSWNTEQPGEASRAAVLAAAGLGAGLTVAKAGAGGTLAPKAAAIWSAATIAKWAAVIVGISAAGATLAYVKHPKSASPPRVESTPAATVASPVPSPIASAPPSEVAAPVAAAPVEAPQVRAADPRVKPSPRPHPSALGEQVSALDAARRALTAGDASTALRQLDDYDARFRGGALSEESEVLRVEALLAQGDHAAASRVADRFLAAHPNSPHAARVRALLASP